LRGGWSLEGPSRDQVVRLKAAEGETMAIRAVKRLVKAKPTIEGAGVRLRRAFGFGTTADYDPFLLLDDFRNERPQDYLAGFPWHPHRGIETILTSSRGPWSMETASGTAGPSPPATSSG